MNHRARSQIRIPGSNRDVAAHRRPFAQIQVRAQRRQIAANVVTRIDLNLPEHHRNVPSHVSVDVNRAKQARNITRRLSFGDRNVTADTGAVLAAFGECRNGRDKKKSNGEEQSTHKKTSWASVRLQLIRRETSFARNPVRMPTRNALWMLPLKHP